MEGLTFVLGALLLTLVFWDLFQTVVVPRPTPGWFRIGRYLVRGSWRLLRAIRDGRPGRSYDRVLGLFAPAATVALLAAWLAATERPTGRHLAFAAGVALSLAVQTRETSLVYVALFGLWFLLSPAGARRITWWAAPGFAVPMAVQMLIHGLATGDPLLRFQLALDHGRIPSTELDAHVDTSRSPLLNPDFIAGWKPAAGIDLHWSVNPLINLLAHPAIGITLLGALFMLAAYGARGLLDPTARRRAMRLLGAAALASLLLIYVLAIDPKPRMFMPLAAAASMTAAAFGVAAWQAGQRPLAAIIALAVTANAILVLGAQPSMTGVEAAAGRWIAEANAPPSSDETTRSRTSEARARSRDTVEPAPGTSRPTAPRSA